VAEAFG